MIARQDQGFCLAEVFQIEPEQPQAIRMTILKGFVDTRPLAPKSRRQGEFCKRTQILALQVGVAQLEECISSIAEEGICRLTKLD